MSPPLRVLIADDHAPTRAGVRMALERDGCVVCAEVANADDAVEAALRERPDVCLLDIGMPGHGIRAVAQINARMPDIPVVMLTVSRSSDDLFDALRAGAAGYLLKDMDPEQLAPAVRAAAAGEATLPGVLTARLIEEFRRRGAQSQVTLDDGRHVELTPRERDVLELLADGLTTAEIAHRLFLSPVTVRRHLSILMHKLDVTSRDEARRLALQRRDRPASDRSTN
jgi:two-component system, NarL family, nitrate/nitrite response regulator NarL